MYRVRYVKPEGGWRESEEDGNLYWSSRYTTTNTRVFYSTRAAAQRALIASGSRTAEIVEFEVNEV